MFVFKFVKIYVVWFIDLAHTRTIKTGTCCHVRTLACVCGCGCGCVCVCVCVSVSVRCVSVRCVLERMRLTACACVRVLLLFLFTFFLSHLASARIQAQAQLECAVALSPPAPAVAVASPAAAAAPARLLLYVEDNPANLKLGKQYFLMEHFQNVMLHCECRKNNNTNTYISAQALENMRLCVCAFVLEAFSINYLILYS